MPPAGPRVTACDLATEDEVAAVQRTPITATKSNEVPTGEFVASQCYYAATEPASSVTIAVIQRDAARPSKRSVRRYWESTFGKFRERRGDDVEEIEKNGTAQREEEDSGGRDNEEKEEEHPVHLIRVEGVGQEAFWSRTAIGGVLYALQGEKIVRVSVGGRASIEEKLERSEALARSAVARLPK